MMLLSLPLETFPASMVFSCVPDVTTFMQLLSGLRHQEILSLCANLRKGIQISKLYVSQLPPSPLPLLQTLPGYSIVTEPFPSETVPLETTLPVPRRLQLLPTFKILQPFFNLPYSKPSWKILT